MYLIKRLSIDPTNGSFVVNTGIKAKITKYSEGRPSRFVIPEAFWGGTDIKLSSIGRYVETQEKGTVVIEYATSYKMELFRDVRYILNLIIGNRNTKNIEGYIIFVDNGSNFKTNGETLYGGYRKEIIVVLKEGQYLDFSRQRVEVVKGKLMHVI